MEWKTVKLGDVASRVCSGGTPNSRRTEFYDGDIPWLNTKEINFNRIYSTERNITELGLNNSSAKWIEENSIIIAMYGATAGKVAISKIPLTTNQACCNIRIDDKIADYEFVYYYLCNNYTTLASYANGGAQQNLNSQIIKDFPLLLPPLTEQKRIAAILSALDAKIENNNRINANLEAQAQALYKSWFVDFEPWGGKMPEDWKEGKAEEFFEINIGKTPPRKEKEWFTTAFDKIWVSISDMANCGVFIADSSEYLTSDAVKKFNVVMVPQNTVLLSFKLTIGRVAIAQRELTTNEAIARFILPILDLREYLYLYLRNYNYNLLGSTSSIATAVNSKIIKQMKMVMPTNLIINNFHQKVKPLFDQIAINQKESQRLAQLRDTLLPKLMKGEIKV